jgi:hypothetical protein
VLKLFISGQCLNVYHANKIIKSSTAGVKCHE